MSPTSESHADDCLEKSSEAANLETRVGRRQETTKPQRRKTTNGAAQGIVPHAAPFSPETMFRLSPLLNWPWG